MPDAVVCWGGRASGGAVEPEHAEDAPEGDSDGGVQCGVHRPTGASGTESNGDVVIE